MKECVFIFCLIFTSTLFCGEDYWHLSSQGGITWHVRQETRLPHQDNIEMAGRQVAAIVYYNIDADKRLSV